MSRNKTERDLKSQGYTFSGCFASGPSGKTEMLERAKRYRAEGYYARVITKVCVGRVYNTDGHSVYIKRKAAGEKNND